jgi:hypothetical protein
MTRPFSADYGLNQNVTTGGVSASISLRSDSKSVRIANTGATNPAYVKIGIGAQTATSADLVIRPASEIIIHKGDGPDTLAYLQHTGATTLSIITGEGGV